MNNLLRAFFIGGDPWGFAIREFVKLLERKIQDFYSIEVSSERAEIKRAIYSSQEFRIEDLIKKTGEIFY